MTEQLNRVMAIMAHADDAEFGYAGTIAKWVRHGMEVTYVLVTNGNKGSADPNITHDQLVELRKTEQLAAAKVLGVKEVVFMGYPDGELEHTLGLRRDLTRVIRQHKPDIAIVPDPTTWYYRDNYINHPDHRAVGEAALAAIYPSARDRLTFPELLAEGLEPHKVRDIYITVSNEPNSWVDITETIEIKIAALREHKSQLSDPEAVEKMVREWAEFNSSGLETRYAERFRRITLT